MTILSVAAMRIPWRASSVILILAMLYGCGSDSTQNLSPDDFYARRPPPGSSPVPRLDRPGIITVPGAHAAAPPLAGPVSNPQPNSGVVSELGQGDLQPLTAAQPTTQPLAISKAPTTEPALATDQFMTLGGVVCVVNGTPIYANKVLRRDAPILKELARKLDLANFQAEARESIDRTITEMIRDELEVASAERTLDPKDIQLAKDLTTRWREEQFNEAGGSEEIARQRASENGDDFDDLEDEQYRHFLQMLYYFRKIDPQIEITADDERKYYQAHLDAFTTQTKAVIQLIESDPAKHGGDRSLASAKINDIRIRCLAGEDFAGYARTENDLPGATGPDGDGGLMTLQPNTFALTKVDAQIWKDVPGQISDVIEDQGAFYLFKLVSREYGTTKSFADKAVQDAITKRLSDQQQEARREAELYRLEKQDIVFSDPRMVDAAVEMAVQNYSRWSKE